MSAFLWGARTTLPRRGDLLLRPQELADDLERWPAVVVEALVGPAGVVPRDVLVQVRLQFGDGAVEPAPQQLLQHVLDRLHKALRLAVRPGMAHLGVAVLGAQAGAQGLEWMRGPALVLGAVVGQGAGQVVDT